MTTPNTPPALTPDDFLPLQVRPDAHGITRPSRSYWQDAWARLRRNRRAMLSLWIIIALLSFALLGPLLWTVDPARQDIDQIRFLCTGAMRVITHHVEQTTLIGVGCRRGRELKGTID